MITRKNIFNQEVIDLILLESNETQEKIKTMIEATTIVMHKAARDKGYLSGRDVYARTEREAYVRKVLEEHLALTAMKENNYSRASYKASIAIGYRPTNWLIKVESYKVYLALIELGGERVSVLSEVPSGLKSEDYRDLSVYTLNLVGGPLSAGENELIEQLYRTAERYMGQAWDSEKANGVWVRGS
jgi:hypothetical protein